MKKIKFLLLGIVSILGISFSSAEITYLGHGTTSNGFTFNSGITEFTGDSSYSPDCYFFADWASNESISFNSLVYSNSVFACGDISVNNNSSSVTLYPLIDFYTSYGGSSSFFPYYSNGLVSRSDSDLSSTFVFPSNSAGDYYFGENSCAYIYYYDYWSSSDVKLCDVDNYDNCYSTFGIQNTFICGDGFHYINNLGVYVNLDYYVFKFESGGGNNSGQDFESPVQGGIWDYNTMLIEKAILCYMSSGSFGGEYGSCDGINYSGFINQYNPSYSTWSGSSIEDYYGQLLFTNAQPVLSNYCVNTDLIQYPFCSQLDLYSGAYLLYFFENGKLDYYVLGDGFGVDLGNLGSGQLGELTCTGVWCNNISQGLPEYIRPISSGNIDVVTGEILDQSWFLDFIDNHSFFSCPYSYSGSYFVLGKDLINRLGGRDLMIPINCFIAGFSAGQKVFFFGDPNQGAYWSGSLINGNTLSHQRLYTFFDLILSMGILLLGLKLFSHMTGRH